MASMNDEVVLLDVSERIATITLNRPAARNALSTEVLRMLPQLMIEADSRDDVDVLILTGADPAFCAGLDLRELGGGGIINDKDETGAGGGLNAYGVHGPFPPVTKPLIGAINGVAVTGGFELALNCDFLIASEHAKFALMHVRFSTYAAPTEISMLMNPLGRSSHETRNAGGVSPMTQARLNPAAKGLLIAAATSNQAEREAVA